MNEPRHELDVEGRVDLGFGGVVIDQYEVVVCGACEAEFKVPDGDLITVAYLLWLDGEHARETGHSSFTEFFAALSRLVIDVEAPGVVADLRRYLNLPEDP